LIRKVIIIFMLINLPLLAFKLNVKGKINSKCLTNIIKNGWSDNNKTLNNLIVTNAQKNFNSFNKKVKNFIVIKKGRDKYGMPWYPKFVLDRDDILLMLSYIKYLEKNGRVKEVKNLYVNILNGYKNEKVEPASGLKVIIDVIYQSFIVDALNQSIKENIYEESDKKEICFLCKNALLLNKDEFINAIKTESETINKVWEKSSLDDIKKYSKLGTDYNDLVYKNLMEDVGRKIKKFNKFYYKQLFIAIDSEDAKEFDKLNEDIKSEKDNIAGVSGAIVFVSNYLFIKGKILLGVDIKEFGYLSTVIAKTLVISTIPKIKTIFFDYKKQLESNKKLLKELGCE